MALQCLFVGCQRAQPRQEPCAALPHCAGPKKHLEKHLESNSGTLRRCSPPKFGVSVSSDECQLKKNQLFTREFATQLQTLLQEERMLCQKRNRIRHLDLFHWAGVLVLFVFRKVMAPDVTYENVSSLEGITSQFQHLYLTAEG